MPSGVMDSTHPPALMDQDVVAKAIASVTWSSSGIWACRWNTRKTMPGNGTGACRIGAA